MARADSCVAGCAGQKILFIIVFFKISVENRASSSYRKSTEGGNPYEHGYTLYLYGSSAGQADAEERAVPSCGFEPERVPADADGIGAVEPAVLALSGPGTSVE